MKIHKEGYLTIMIAGLFVSLLNFGLLYVIPHISYVHYTAVFSGLVLFFLTVRFFRVPKRNIKLDENTILSSADGTVVAIEEVEKAEFFGDKRIQVSVFMSPLNVHVNYYPISGIIQKADHKPGKHMPAFLPKSSMENEQSSIVLKHKNNQEILIRQIAGSMARRIVFFSQKEQIVLQGEQLGIIKFGSRVDLLLPVSVKINVKLNQKVKAGLDTIAYFN